MYKPENSQNFLRFWDTTRSSNSNQKSRSSINQQEEKKTLSRGFCFSGGQLSDNKRKWKIDKYLDLAWELKEKPWKMKVRVITIVVGALRTVPKDSEKKLQEFEDQKNQVK